MNEPNSTVRGISDTARWVAYFRARETQRPDASFRDPYAERLAGEHGLHIANTLPDGNKHEWVWVARTYLFDQFLAHAIQDRADLVMNLAAGLDARPYRMNLPATLQWVEVDLPDIISSNQLNKSGLVKSLVLIARPYRLCSNVGSRAAAPSDYQHLPAFGVNQQSNHKSILGTA
ncbi:MAG: class I SAM-dependent methyltransferase [Terracidiphilus sp.]|jgi:O-methyltransferase involved in polyketide biosynthesis